MPIEKQPLGTYALRPAAAPVSTYVRPPEVRPDSSVQLAAALQDLQPTLQKFVGMEAEKQNKETTDRAQKMAVVQQVKSYQEAVDKGLLKPGESDLFVRAYEEQRGRVMALEQRNQAFAAYEAWDGKDAAVDGDPEAAAKFGNFLTDIAGGAFSASPNDNVQRGMKDGVESTLREISALHGQRTANMIEQRFQDEIGKEVGLLLDSEIAGVDARYREWAAGDRSAPPPAFDPSGMWGRVNALKNTARYMRVPGQKINEIVVEAVVSSALRRAQMGDPYAQEYLQVAMRDWTDPETGKTVPGPASTNAGRLALEQAQSRVVTEYQQWEAYQARKEKDRIEAEKNAWLGENLPLIYRDRRPPTTAQLQRIGQLFGPDAVKDVMSAITTGRSVADYDSPEAVGAAWSDLIMGRVDAAGAIRWLGQFRDPDTQQRYFDDFARLADLGGGDASKGATKLRTDPIFGPYVKGMDKLLETNDDPLGISKLFPPAGMARADAMAGFQSDILDFLATHENPTRADKRKFMRELSAQYEQQVKSMYEQSGAPTKPAASTNPLLDGSIPAR